MVFPFPLRFLVVLHRLATPLSVSPLPVQYIHLFDLVTWTICERECDPYWRRLYYLTAYLSCIT
jgi:hypothetical protein